MVFSSMDFLGRNLRSYFDIYWDQYWVDWLVLKSREIMEFPYSLTEEFVSAYRMHSLLPETLVFRDITSSTSEDKHPPILHEYFSFSLLTLYLQILGTNTMDIFLPFFFSTFYGLSASCCRVYSFLWRHWHKCTGSQELSV